MITRLGAAILVGSLVTVGSACAEPALDPDRFLDFGTDLTAVLAVAEPAPSAATAPGDADLTALSSDLSFDMIRDPQPDGAAAPVAADLASAETPPDPAVATEARFEEPADFALILPEPPPVDLALILPELPVDIAAVEAPATDLSDFDQAALADAAMPGESSVDVAEALAPEHFLDARDGETLAWIAEDLAGPEVVETGSIGDGPSPRVTGEHAEFMLDLEPLAP